jgi:hypothetical protein
MKDFQQMAVTPVDAQYLKYSEEMRNAASQVAMTIARADHRQSEMEAELDAHVSFMLQAIAAEHMAYGRETLAKHYLASAMRVEAGV